MAETHAPSRALARAATGTAPSSAAQSSHPPQPPVPPSRMVLDQIADKWSVLILAALCHGPLRFNAVRRALAGVTQTALTQALRRLERNGIVARRVVAVRPVAVEYAITPLGRTLEPLFRALDAWTHEHLAEVETAREAFDQSTDASLREPVVIVSLDTSNAVQEVQRLRDGP